MKDATTAEILKRRPWEDRGLAAVDAVREYGVETAVALSVGWTSVVLGNEDTYGEGRAACLASTLRPALWGALSALAAGFAVGAVAYAAQHDGVWADRARGFALLAETALLAWVAALVLCGRDATTSLVVGFVFVTALTAAGRFVCLCVDLARDDAPAVPLEPHGDGP